MLAISRLKFGRHRVQNKDATSGATRKRRSTYKMLYFIGRHAQAWLIEVSRLVPAEPFVVRRNVLLVQRSLIQCVAS